MGQSKNERMLELVELLNKASRSYYQDAQEIMSNYEYDRLYDELVFNQFFYYLFIFYVLCKITFEQRHILVYNAKENCYHGTGKGVLI